MDDITLVQECVVKVEEDEVNAPVGALLQPKMEMEEEAEERELKMEYNTSEPPVSEHNDSEEEELKPLAAVYIKTEVEIDKETEEDHLAVFPLADCKESEEKSPLLKALLLREKKDETAELEEEADARISNMKSKQPSAEELKDDAKYASGSNRTDSPCEEHEASTPQNEDVQTHRQPIAFMHSSDSSRHKTLMELEREHRVEPHLLTFDTCQRQFTYQREFVSHCGAHINEDEKETNFPCGTCGKEFKCGDKLKRHLLIHTGEKPYACDHCGKGFTQRYYVNVHRRQHTGEQPYSCSICNKRFADKGHLVLHTRRHLNIKPYECKECGKKFVQSNHYTMHLRVHTGERPYKCSLCSKTFARTVGLNTHMFTHSRDRKQMSECQVCGDSFKTTYMINHMRTHTGEKPYKCRFCEAMFARSTHRRKHEETHSDRKPIQCKECSKSLLSKQSLKRHMRCHTGEKQYKCAYCDKVFAQRKSYKIHEMTHTKEYPYNCAECGKGFPDKWRLIKHILTHGKQNVISSAS